MSSGESHCPRCDGSAQLLRGNTMRYMYSCRTCSHMWSQPRKTNNYDALLQRMDSKLDVPQYIRLHDDLPMRIDALRRLFRTALWAVRLQPAYARRISALASMTMLPVELKIKILGFANLLRTTPPHDRIEWPTRALALQIRRLLFVHQGIEALVIML